jgi:phenylpropionate dioxygenase-like ring-hydroxylating dioxygenase large terminal subunit
MIRNQRCVELESDEVEAHPVGVTRLGEKMVLWRDQAGKVHAAVDRLALSVGRIQVGNLQ